MIVKAKSFFGVCRQSCKWHRKTSVENGFNKRVLQRERKRHTASLCIKSLAGGGGGEVGTLGYPLPHPDLARGVGALPGGRCLGVPPPPYPDLAGGGLGIVDMARVGTPSPCWQTNKLKLLSSPILRMRAVKIGSVRRRFCIQSVLTDPNIHLHSSYKMLSLYLRCFYVNWPVWPGPGSWAPCFRRWRWRDIRFVGNPLDTAWTGWIRRTLTWQPAVNTAE